LKRFAQAVAARVAQGLIWCVSLLSLHGARALGTLVGNLLGWMPTETASITRTNIAHCFPDLDAQSREQLARGSLRQTATFAMEAGMLWHWSLPRCENTFLRVDGAELLEEGRRAGRGVLVLVPHFGNWEVLALYLGRYGYTCLYDPPRLQALEEPIVRSRSRTGGRLLPIGVAGIKAVLKALRAGELVALLPDQVPDRFSGVYAPFFGKPALTMTLVQRLMRQTGASAVLGSATRADGGFVLCFKPAEPGIDAEDPVAAATALNRMTEQLVHTAPEQYQWEYKRFKRQPSEADGLYD